MVRLSDEWRDAIMDYARRSQVTVTCEISIPGDLVVADTGDLDMRLVAVIRQAADCFFDGERRRRDEARAETAEDAARAIERTEAEQMLKVKLAEIRAEATAKVARETAARAGAGERRLAEAQDRATRPPADSGAALAQAIWDAFRRGDPFALQNMFIPITPGDLLRLWRDEAFLVALSAALEAGDGPAAATRQLIAAHLAPAAQGPDAGGELPPATLRLPALNLADNPAPDAPTEAPGDAERALLAAIQDRVVAALLSGRRVNVVELGRRERAALPLAEDSMLTLSIAEAEGGAGRRVTLRARPADQDSALSVYFDPEITTD